MKRSIWIFLNLIICLVLIDGFCSFLNTEQGWTTISESKPDEPTYSLQAKGSVAYSDPKKMHQPEWIGT